MTTAKSSPLLNQVRAAIRLRHYSIRTEKTYVDWIKRFIYVHAGNTRSTWVKPRSSRFYRTLRFPETLRQARKTRL
jgi:phage-related protein